MWEPIETLRVALGPIQVEITEMQVEVTDMDVDVTESEVGVKDKEVEVEMAVDVANVGWGHRPSISGENRFKVTVTMVEDKPGLC